MRHVLDTNILINANRIDFPLSGGHVFWDWLVELGKNEIIIIPEKVYKEIGDGNDALPAWLNSNKAFFFYPTADAIYSLPIVLREYGNNISDISLERMGADPYVIAHAHACSGRVISNEAPRERATSAHNKSIPTICSSLKIECWSLPRLLWELRTP